MKGILEDGSSKTPQIKRQDF